MIVNFFASWCVPCRAEHPTLTALAEAGNPLYGVNYRDAPADALGFLSDLGNPYDLIGADPEARTGRAAVTNARPVPHASGKTDIPARRLNWRNRPCSRAARPARQSALL